MKALSKESLINVTAGFNNFDYAAYTTRDKESGLAIIVEDNATLYLFEGTEISMSKLVNSIDSGEIDQLLYNSDISGISNSLGVTPTRISANEVSCDW
jgi:hypothetical protein